jgi:hypothetical protein
MDISAVTLDRAPNQQGIRVIRIPAILDVVFLFCQFFVTLLYRFPPGFRSHLHLSCEDY